ncbi:MAG: phenylalanine--tRNA ligase subunit beta, partial [Hyphomicrobiaceae bacterium]|nr:phenylalanine--tRNA ligase subunit beta [Hyphomicrobiaceae bacterium]
ELSDPIIEIGLTPNRSDCTGVRGIARDLAATGIGILKPEPKLEKVEGIFECPIKIKLKFDTNFKDACPVYYGRFVKDVKNGQSPAWMRQRLMAIGLRPRTALVDIINYICMDNGYPLHVYDANKISNRIHARMTEHGEKFLAIDGNTYISDDSVCAIADQSGIIAYGGVLGGKKSSCKIDTTDILIECAYFEPVRTAETGRKNKINSDARYRFERGVDPEFIETALDLATDMILKFCGGQPSKKKKIGTTPVLKRSIHFKSTHVKNLSGLNVSTKECKKILQAVGCEIDGKGGEYMVTVPSWRNDIHGSADLVEEIIRIVGLDNIPAVPLPRDFGVKKPILTNRQKQLRITRRALASRGLVEVITWSFLPNDQAKHFGGGDFCLELQNPISSDFSSMRPSILPGLLETAKRNTNQGSPNIALFELGQTYVDETSEGQLSVASGVRFKTAKLTGSGRHWSGDSCSVDTFDAKSDVLSVLAALGINTSNTQVTRDAPAWYHPGRSGVIRMGPKIIIGYFGEIHPATLRFIDIGGPAIAFEIFLSALPQKKRKAPKKPSLCISNLLPVRRDFAFIVGQEVQASDVIKAAASCDRSLIKNINVFDIFEGDILHSGKKSIAIEITLQPKTTTLLDVEIEAFCSQVIKMVKNATGGEIRY